MENYLLAHGLGFTNDYWQNLTPLLDGEIFYFDDEKLDENREYIGIGHSLGFLKLNSSGLKFKHLIGLQGGLSYCGNSEKLRKKIVPIVDETIELYKIDPVQSLRNSYKMYGYPLELPENIDGKKLVAELELLKKSYPHCGTKTTIIGTTLDIIFPKAVIEDNFKEFANVTIKILDLDIIHTLGFHYPEVVLDVLK
jgi:pimeloyl-[acyl-carrier protein] methyl ester esterase